MPTLALLRRILDRVADEVRARGLVGEERLAQTLYLVLTSRLLDKQVSAGVKGHSASGKSYTVETVTKFFPPEAYLEFTAMSERALVYSPEQYAHRTLIVYEVVALREGVEDDMTSYFVRSLLSEGRIDYAVTVRDKDGGFTTKTIVKEGPTNLVFTTTKTKVHAENETRILSLGTDDSREQTARVLLELADEEHGGSDLERVAGPATLAGRRRAPGDDSLCPGARGEDPPGRGQAAPRRRVAARAHPGTRGAAPGHPRARRAGRIIADLDDYAVVRDLVADIMAEGVGATVSETVRQTVEAVAAHRPAEGVELRPLADKLKLDKSNVGRRLAAGRGRRLRPQPGGQARQARPMGHRRPATRNRGPAPRSRATAQHHATSLTRTVAVLRWYLREKTDDRSTALFADPVPVCIVCGQQLPPRSGHIYCSSVCAQAHRAASEAQP